MASDPGVFRRERGEAGVLLSACVLGSRGCVLAAGRDVEVEGAGRPRGALGRCWAPTVLFLVESPHPSSARSPSPAAAPGCPLQTCPAGLGKGGPEANPETAALSPCPLSFHVSGPCWLRTSQGHRIRDRDGSRTRLSTLPDPSLCVYCQRGLARRSRPWEWVLGTVDAQ